MLGLTMTSWKKSVTMVSRILLAWSRQIFTLRDPKITSICVQLDHWHLQHIFEASMILWALQIGSGEARLSSFLFHPTAQHPFRSRKLLPNYQGQTVHQLKKYFPFKILLSPTYFYGPVLFKDNLSNPFLRTSRNFWDIVRHSILLLSQIHTNYVPRLSLIWLQTYGVFGQEGMVYWVSQGYGLWVEIFYEPSWWIWKATGYWRLWVTRAMG